MVCPECGLVETTREWQRLARRRPWRKRFAFSLLVLFIIMYAPYSWLLFIDYPWTDYHWQWVKMWLGLPGLILAVAFDFGETAEITVAHAFSFAVLVGCALVASRGRWWLVAVAMLLALLSMWNAIGLYHAFLM